MDAQHGRLPTTDPFTYTMQGRPWHLVNGLADLLFYGVYRLGAAPGLVVLKAVVAFVTLTLIGLCLREVRVSRGGLVGLLVAVAVLLQGRYSLDRPLILGGALLGLPARGAAQPPAPRSLAPVLPGRAAAVAARPRDGAARRRPDRRAPRRGPRRAVTLAEPLGSPGAAGPPALGRGDVRRLHGDHGGAPVVARRIRRRDVADRRRDGDPVHRGVGHGPRGRPRPPRALGADRRRDRRRAASLSQGRLAAPPPLFAAVTRFTGTLAESAERARGGADCPYRGGSLFRGARASRRRC